MVKNMEQTHDHRTHTGRDAVSALTITRDPEVQGGVPCFAGTRIPVRAVFEFFSAGWPIEDVAVEYPALDLKVLALASALYDEALGATAPTQGET
jgi:uncharacterized protein (DUF433 family)